MSRRKMRFVFAALAVAGGLALAPPNAQATGQAAQEPDAWSIALRWVAQLWEEAVVRTWETQGSQVEPDESQPPVPPDGGTGDDDRGWGLDPNG